RSVPPDATVMIVSKGDNALIEEDRVRGWHVPQTASGVYAGHYPADSAAAIDHLESLRAKGGDYLLLPSTALWWLDHYQEFKVHLERQYSLAPFDSSIGLLYDLSGRAADCSDLESTLLRRIN